MDIQKIISLVTETQGLIKNREMAAHVKKKGLADYVTQVDIAVQDFLKKELFALAPDIQFLGEETGLQEIKADSFWILDPVDGTTNLMHDYQHNVVSLTLCLVPQGGWSVPGRPQNWPRLCCFGAGICRLRQAKGLFRGISEPLRLCCRYAFSGGK